MFAEFLKVLQVNGQTAALIVFLTNGLTWVYGKFGAAGKVQLGAAVGTGALLGGGFYLSSMGVPATFEGWLYFALTAILFGLLPSGFYETVKGAAAKANEISNPPAN